MSCRAPCRACRESCRRSFLTCLPSCREYECHAKCQTSRRLSNGMSIVKRHVADRVSNSMSIVTCQILCHIAPIGALAFLNVDYSTFQSNSCVCHLARRCAFCTLSYMGKNAIKSIVYRRVLHQARAWG